MRNRCLDLFLLFLGMTCVGVACVGVSHAQVRTQAKSEIKPSAVSSQYVITGVVVNSIDGSPVPHCRLTPTLEEHGGVRSRRFPASSDSFEADERGHFSISFPSAGRWDLRASARGYVTQAYEEHGSFSTAVVLTAESPKIDLQFKLSPEASIKGIVLDEAGEPVRDAQITLHLVPPLNPGGPQGAGSTRGNARTDDRGMYELANLSPGNYRLMVQAHPWYAEASQRGGVPGSPIEPSLDFAYPLTWFPGSSDGANAETIVLHAGDVRRADFNLVPVPSIHLRIVPPTEVAETAGVRGQAFPVVQQVASGSGGPGFVPVTTHQDAQGQFDVGGLTPGVYQVRLAGPNQDGHSAMVEVTANSARTVDLSAPSREVARITIHIDGYANAEEQQEGGRGGGLRVNLIDTDTRRGGFSSGGDEGFAGRRVQRDSAADRILEVPPGRYEVVLQGRPNLYLMGLSGKGAEVSGRYVIAPAGESTVTVHVANGRANLSGVATLGGEAVAGAMVLLVPITIEDADSIDFLRQDQTNTDGSFDLENVIPGQYILVAIDRGWQINWGDRSTLRRYLAQGLPIELHPSATMKQKIVAQTP